MANAMTDLASRQNCQCTIPIIKKTFAEFFAGIGLVRVALRRSGWECVYANDIDPKKGEIYRANFPVSDEFDERDIWDTEGVAGRLTEVPFLVTSSFPCTDLSVAGDYRGFEGPNSSTFFGFTKVIRALSSRPQLILLENVIGLLTAGEGKDFAKATNEIADLGYRVDAFVINAQSFVPQSRPRVFIVGVHETVKSPLVIDNPLQPSFGDAWYQAVDNSAAVRPVNLRQLMNTIQLRHGWITTPIKPPAQQKYDIRTIIDLDDCQDWWDAEHVAKHYEIMNDAHRVVIDRCIKEKGQFVGTGFRRKRADRLRLEVRFDGVAGCLRTPRGGSGRQIVVVVDSGVLKMRWMSSREYARLQGADGFKFVENERQMLFGFGDAVCVPVIEWIDKCVLTPIFEWQDRAAENR